MGYAISRLVLADRPGLIGNILERDRSALVSLKATNFSFRLPEEIPKSRLVMATLSLRGKHVGSATREDDAKQLVSMKIAASFRLSLFRPS